MKSVCILFAALALTGCASGYSQFYQTVPGATPEAVAAGRAGPPPALPLLERSGDTPDNIAAAYARHGYLPIGFSSFTSGGRETDQSAREQGAKVGADVVVVVNPAYAGSTSSVIPLTLPTSQTSYSTGSATAYGAGGSVTAYGNSTTTTYGSETTYIPMTVDRYTYGAIYLVKKQYFFGANWRDLNDEERQRLQSNKGVLVINVVNDTPAFDADVLPGDIILAINGDTPSDSEGFNELVKSLRGKSVQVDIARGDQRITKMIQFRQ